LTVGSDATVQSRTMVQNWTHLNWTDVWSEVQQVGWTGCGVGFKVQRVGGQFVQMHSEWFWTMNACAFQSIRITWRWTSMEPQVSDQIQMLCHQVSALLRCWFALIKHKSNSSYLTSVAVVSVRFDSFGQQFGPVSRNIETVKPVSNWFQTKPNCYVLVRGLHGSRGLWTVFHGVDTVGCSCIQVGEVLYSSLEFKLRSVYRGTHFM
jgi:hypothetical protein